MSIANEPAYPTRPEFLGGDWRHGLTKREYFAAKAMAGLLASPDCSASAEDEQIVRASVDIADALIAELGGRRGVRISGPNT